MPIIASDSVPSKLPHTTRALVHRLGRLLLIGLLAAVLLPLAGCNNDSNSDDKATSMDTAQSAEDSAEPSGAVAPPEPAAPVTPAADPTPAEAGSAIAQMDAFIADNLPSKADNPNWRLKLATPPQLDFDAGSTYYWNLETNVGVIRFKMLPDVAPMHVSSTIYLTNLGYYDDLKFHRVIKGFMAQGGDPMGNGRGGPGYKYAGEFSPTALHDSPGTLSMANAGPGTDGSQFFITFKATPALNNRHTVFGKIDSDESLETMQAMEALGKMRDPAPPLKPLFIKKATIVIE